MSPKTILLVSNSGRKPLSADPSTVYRSYNFQIALRNLGVRSRVISQNYLDSPAFSQTEKAEYDAVVFHRPRHSAGLEDILRCFHTRPVIADYDDLVFDLSRYTHLLSQPTWRQYPERLWATLAGFQMAFEMFQVYSSSTQTLSREISSNRREGVSISVLPNFLPPTFALRAQLVRRSRKYGTSTIGYFGGFSHQPELDAVGPILRSYLRKTKRKILINAQLSFDSSGIESQVRFFNPLPLDEAWRFYESVDVAIAPLLPGDFNQSKSAVKLMEAVVHGVPLVGSPNSDYPRLTSPLLFEVREDNEWQSALDSAIATNPTARRDAGAEMGNLAGLEAFTELSMRPFLESLGI